MVSSRAVEKVRIPARRSASSPTRFGRYVVLEKLASGGMADIFKAHPLDFPDQLVALKRIRSDLCDELDFKKMLLDEAKIASRLDHENIARVLGVEHGDDQVALVLQFVDGLDLSRLNHHASEMRAPLLSIPAATRVICEVLAGLDFAHRAKDTSGEPLHLVHRDISPGNVMIDATGSIKIVDFGIARARNRLSKTEAGNVKGKFRYMAPEQIRGDGVCLQTDIYATAILFWELLTGHRIYNDVPVGQMMMSVANAEIPRISDFRSDVPAAVLQVLERATARNPEDRYSSAQALSLALQERFPIDADACRRELRKVVAEARAAERQRGLDRAVVRARSAAERDLESVLERALETPDRVERIDVDWSTLARAESGRWA